MNGHTDRHLVELDDYEISNLDAGLRTLRELGCDTGDWLGQILLKLPDVGYVPNATVARQVEIVRTGTPVATEDWTAKDGRSNSSDEFEAIAKHVESLIRADAHKLINGRADDTARLIVAQLAHNLGMRPTRPVSE